LKRLQSEEGTTLLEVMIAVAVASIALISFISLVLHSLEMEDYSRKITEATLIADDRLKEIERNGYPEIGESEGLIDQDDPSGFSYRLSVKETPIENVRELELEVLWDNKKGSLRMTSFIARR
jgi:general secretion pathway protein I